MASSKNIKHNRQQNELVSIPMQEMTTSSDRNKVVQICLNYFGLTETRPNLSQNILDTIDRYQRGSYSHDGIILGLSSMSRGRSSILGDIHANYTLLDVHKHKKLVQYRDITRQPSLEMDTETLLNIFGMGSSIEEV